MKGLTSELRGRDLVKGLTSELCDLASLKAPAELCPSTSVLQEDLVKRWSSKCAVLTWKWLLTSQPVYDSIHTVPIFTQIHMVN